MITDYDYPMWCVCVCVCLLLTMYDIMPEVSTASFSKLILQFYHKFIEYIRLWILDGHK